MTGKRWSTGIDVESLSHVGIIQKAEVPAVPASKNHKSLGPPVINIGILYLVNISNIYHNYLIFTNIYPPKMSKFRCIYICIYMYVIHAADG